MAIESSQSGSEAEALREQLQADMAGDCLRPLWEYLRLFPNDEVDVAREYFAVRGEGLGAVPARPIDSHPASATHIGPYRILSTLGSGGQGTVYLAEDSRLRRKVALKVLTGVGLADIAAIERFRREAEVASRLAHPGICTIYDTGMAAGVPFIAMGLVEGETLAKKISVAREAASADASVTCVALGDASDRTQMEPRGAVGLAPASVTQQQVGRVIRLFEKCARALHAAHEVGIIHRDVKPGNVMVTVDGDPVILDFGLAREVESDSPTLTKTGDFFGTPAYMSPEQIVAHRIRLDRRTDVWSLGVTMYEAVTLRRPFDAPTREGLYQAIVGKEPVDARRFNRSCPRDLQIVLATALSKDRDRRYQTAADLADDLRRVLESRPIRARPVGPLGRALRWARREPVKAALLGVLLVALPTIAALTAVHLKNRRQVEVARVAELAEAKDELLARASFEVAEGSPERALTLFEEVLSMEGGSPEAAAGVVMAHLRSGRAGEALARVDASGDVLGRGTAWHSLRSDALFRLGRKEEAAAELAGAPEPRNLLDHLLLAQRALNSGEAGETAGFRRAVHHATQAILLSPHPRVNLYDLRIHAAGHVRDRGVLLETMDAAAALFPASRSIAIRAAWALSQLRDPKLAARNRALFEQALRDNPHDEMLLTNFAGFLTEQGHVAEGVDYARKAVEAGPRATAAWANLGASLVMFGKTEEGAEALRKSLQIDPRNTFALNNLATTLHSQQKYEEALAIFKKVIEIDPNMPMSHRNLGIVLCSMGRTEEALPEFRRAAELDPSTTAFMLDQARALSEVGDVSAAVGVLREAVRVDPKSASAHYQLGNALHVRGQVDEAVEELKIATTCDKTHAKAWCNLGLGLQALGRFKEALDALKHGHELGVARADGWDYPSDQWIRECEEVLKLEERFDGVAGSIPPSEDPLECKAFIRIALVRNRQVLAARWFEAMSESDPDAFNRPGEHNAFGAACVALQAAVGRTGDAVDLGDAERERWRRRALEWLREDLGATPPNGASGNGDEKTRLAGWLECSDLAPVRDPVFQTALPAAERKEWITFWEQVRHRALGQIAESRR